MSVRSPMPSLSTLRARLDALPLDRAPLRRAALLTVLLVVLLIAGKTLGAGPSAAEGASARQDLHGPAEEVSATRRSGGWSGGRVLALVLLAVGGGFAFVLHRRSGAGSPSASSVLDVIETHTLGPGQSLRLVACGAEVLLLSVGAEGVRLLRHWPRATFDRATVSFADALATAEADAERAPIRHRMDTMDRVLTATAPTDAAPTDSVPAGPLAGTSAEPPTSPPVSWGEGEPTPDARPAPTPDAAPALRQFQIGHA